MLRSLPSPRCQPNRCRRGSRSSRVPAGASMRRPQNSPRRVARCAGKILPRVPTALPPSPKNEVRWSSAFVQPASRFSRRSSRRSIELGTRIRRQTRIARIHDRQTRITRIGIAWIAGSVALDAGGFCRRARLRPGPSALRAPSAAGPSLRAERLAWSVDGPSRRSPPVAISVIRVCSSDPRHPRLLFSWIRVTRVTQRPRLQSAPPFDALIRNVLSHLHV